MRLSLVVCFLVVALLGVFTICVNGKGSFGSPRSFGGGYNRVGKSGWYSQGYRYRTSGMYWTYGNRYYGYNRYRPNNYDGPENRLGTGIYNDDQARDVLCKRNVSFDPSTIATRYIHYNSTMTCFKQLYSAPGDPGNIYLEDLMLDRYVWNVSMTPYPTFDLIVYPDKDITEADMNITLRLRRLIVLPSVSSFDNPVDEIDLSGLNWSPCSLESCSDTQSNNFGRPSSRLVDSSRVTTSAITATNSRLRITIRLWLSEDFDEDPFFDHIFLHPAQMKIDVSLEALDDNTSPYSGHFIGVEAVIASTATDRGSTVSPISIDSTSSPVVYDPAVMNRVQFGSFNDIADRSAASFAWFTSSNKNKLCYNESFDSACVRFLDWGGLPTSCTAGNASNPSVCEGLLRPGQIARSARFILQTPYAPTYSARWQTHFGFMNPNAVFVPSAAPPAASAALAMAIAVAVCGFFMI